MSKTNKTIFIVGGARSGKSTFAVELAKKKGKKNLFIATCIPQDNEMKKRVRLHKKSRPHTWKTIEEAISIESCLTKQKNKFNTIIIDCLGLYISNLLSSGFKDKDIIKKIESLAREISKAKSTVIIVSNEVGGGIVPDNPLARQFRDIIGLSNQIISKYANTVYTMQVGIPIKIKGES